MSGEIEKLETRLSQLEQSIYANMKPWDRVQVARHPERPTTLQYIEAMCEDFIELHGDRTFGDDHDHSWWDCHFRRATSNNYWTSTW